MWKPLALLCAVALALVAAGCGSSSGSEGSDDRPTTTEAEATTTTAADGGSTDGGGDVEPTNVSADAYAEAFATGLSSGKADDGDLVLPADAAECVAPKFVDAMTVELLNQAGITAEDAADPSFDPSTVGLDEDQAAELVAGFGACDFDIYAELAASITMGLGEDVQQCAAENIDHDLADALLVTSFSSGQSDAEFEAFLADLGESCDLPDL